MLCGAGKVDDGDAADELTQTPRAERETRSFHLIDKKPEFN